MEPELHNVSSNENNIALVLIFMCFPATQILHRHLCYEHKVDVLYDFPFNNTVAIGIPLVLRQC